MNFLKITILLTLLFIAWQDFKFRAVYAWLFAVLLALFATSKSLLISPMLMLSDFAFNLAFLGIQLLLLSLYFSFKAKKWTNIFKERFGLGDLFFLICIATYLSPFNYVAYYILSLLAVLIFSLCWNKFSKTKNVQIPLAGEQAIVMIVCLLISYSNEAFTLTSNHWVFTKLID